MNTKKAMECRNHNVLSSFKQIHDVPFADLINWVYARGYGSIHRCRKNVFSQQKIGLQSIPQNKVLIHIIDRAECYRPQIYLDSRKVMLSHQIRRILLKDASKRSFSQRDDRNCQNFILWLEIIKTRDTCLIMK